MMLCIILYYIVLVLCIYLKDAIFMDALPLDGRASLHSHSKKSVYEVTPNHPSQSTQDRGLTSDNDHDDSIVGDSDMYLSDSAFSPVKVLCELNGYTVPAIIDTGAQITIISTSCAKRCRVMNLIDRKYSGRAVGVGSSEIIGRINNLQLRVGPITFQSRVAVLRESSVDFLIGMDFLRRFKCDLCLTEGVLKLKVRDRAIRVPFMTDRKSFGTFNDDAVEINDGYDMTDDNESSFDDLDDDMDDDIDDYKPKSKTSLSMKKSPVQIYSAKSRRSQSAYGSGSKSKSFREKGSLSRNIDSSDAVSMAGV